MYDGEALRGLLQSTKSRALRVHKQVIDSLRPAKVTFYSHAN